MGAIVFIYPSKLFRNMDLSLICKLGNIQFYLEYIQSRYASRPILFELKYLKDYKNCNFAGLNFIITRSQFSVSCYQWQLKVHAGFQIAEFRSVLIQRPQSLIAEVGKRLDIINSKYNSLVLESQEKLLVGLRCRENPDLRKASHPFSSPSFTRK